MFDDLLQYPLTGSLQSPTQNLQGMNARSDLPMSNAARKQLGIQPEIIRNSDKHATLPMHDLHVGQRVMFQDSTIKFWYQAVIESMCPNQEVMRYLQEMVLFREKIQSHLKPFIPQNKDFQSSKCVSQQMAQSNHMWPVKAELKKKSQVNNPIQVQASIPKKDT